jgi:exodeoxyribonuclease V alpha subunit
MKRLTDLSPLGTARAALGATPDDEAPLLAWLGPVRERLAARFNLDDEVAFLAWELGRWPEGLDHADQAALVLLALTALIAQSQGSTRLPLADRAFRLQIAAQLLPADDPPLGLGPEAAVALADRLRAGGRLDAVVGGADDFTPLVVEGPYLYLQKMRALEQWFADALGRRLRHDDAGSDAAVEAAWIDVAARPAVRDGVALALSPDQARAVRAVARHRLALVSGGPGTGKTTIVVAVLRLLARLNIPPEAMLLAAPTGKAAQRMDQAVRSALTAVTGPSDADRALEHLPGAQTLHRLLGYSPRSGRFLHHQNNRLAGRVVVVDEASMIDLVLMERLVRSVRDDAHLVLLGDDRQLPSVDAGAVFRDLLSGEGSLLGARSVRLTESHRMRPDDPSGRNILLVSRAVDRGVVPALAARRDADDAVVARASAADVTFEGVEFLECAEGSDAGERLLDRWHAEVVRALPGYDDLVERAYALRPDGFDATDATRLARLFDHFERSRVLGLTRVRPTGTDRINAALHARAFAARAVRPERADDLLTGEPVMMQVNDYARRLFNGDQGVVLNVSAGGRPAPMVVFRRDGGFAAYRIGPLRPVLLRSYAMTVHKAQGSEFDHLALVLPDADIPLNSREILYTALTRARRSVTIIGTRAVWSAGVGRSTLRYSGVAERLRAVEIEASAQG